MTNKPSYRFEDYAEPWEQRKLGEIVDITSGDAPAKFFEGNTPYVKVDDLNYCDKYLTATQNHVDTSYKIKKIEKGSVVFPKRGAAILTNKIRILNVQAYMDTNMMSLNTDKANLEFLYTVISNIGLYK
ncbi:restriction endonuclease subunit S, partial [Streptococcus sp. 2.1]